MSESINETITAAIHELMNFDPSSVAPETPLNTISEWDSFNNLMLISKLQDTLGIEFSAAEIDAAETLGSVFELVQDRMLVTE